MRLMKRITATVLGMVLLCSGGAGWAAPRSIQWEKDLASALKAAQAANKLVMVDFYTDWCGWCKELDRVTYRDKRVVGESANFVNVKVNAESSATIARKYQVQGFPTIVFMDGQGDEVYRVVGYQLPDQFLQSMKEAQRTQAEFIQTLEKVRAAPEDLQANVSVAIAYFKRRNVEKGKEFMDAALRLDPQNTSALMPELYMHAGLAFGMSGNLKQAIQLLSEGLQKFPTSSVVDETRFYLGLSYLFDNQKENAAKTLREVATSAKSAELRQAARERLAELDREK